tara:strand:- start:100 stop:339 length:240 start_codon:yes stop_codon:yes gene_type:complete
MKEYTFTRSRTAIHIMSDSIVADSEEEALKLANEISEEDFTALLESDWHECDIFKEDISVVTSDDILEVHDIETDEHFC